VSRFEDKELTDWYRMNNPCDELLIELGIDFDRVTLKPSMKWVGLQVTPDDMNHIWTNPRRDLRSNLINLTRRAHQAFHANLNLGRMLCMVAKARKAERMGEPKEFDIQELNLCSGKHVLGWIESHDFAEHWAQKLRAELIGRILAEVTA
jgi:hypothetical protein